MKTGYSNGCFMEFSRMILEYDYQCNIKDLTLMKSKEEC